LLTFPIEVKESLVLQTGDIGMLKLTSETVVVYGRDVGAMIAHGDVANASAAGNVGVMSGKKNRRKCAECDVDNKIDDKFCANCGVELK